METFKPDPILVTNRIGHIQVLLYNFKMDIIEVTFPRYQSEKKYNNNLDNKQKKTT